MAHTLPDWPPSSIFLAICVVGRAIPSTHIHASGIFGRPGLPHETPSERFPNALPKERIDAAVSTELEQIWLRVQSKLEAAVDDSTYRVWLAPLRPRELAHGTLTVEAPARSCAWVQRALRASPAELCGRGAWARDNRGGHPRPAPAATTSARSLTPFSRHAHPARNPPTLLTTPRATSSAAHPPVATPAGNPRFSFEHFVIGDSNRLAHAAALTVAELPGQAYNPLFICGSPGVGKTHLLRAIAGLLRSCNPGLSVRTSTGEAFTNEFQLALATEVWTSSRRRFRDVDVLLVDDVQFLERKTRTEEEFFHTFNTLHEAGAQLVLTSDRPPRDLQALEDRLRERFQAGLVADIHPPDLNTRLAILRKRVHQDGIEELAPGTLEVIARRIALDVRALEGALDPCRRLQLASWQAAHSRRACQPRYSMASTRTTVARRLHARRDPKRSLPALWALPRGAPLIVSDCPRGMAPAGCHVPRTRAYRRVATSHWAALRAPRPHDRHPCRSARRA